MRDPAYIEECKRLEIGVRPLTHDKAAELARRIVDMPPDVIAQARAAIEPRPERE